MSLNVTININFTKMRCSMGMLTLFVARITTIDAGVRRATSSDPEICCCFPKRHVQDPVDEIMSPSSCYLSYPFSDGVTIPSRIGSHPSRRDVFSTSCGPLIDDARSFCDVSRIKGNSFDQAWRRSDSTQLVPVLRSVQ